MVVSPAGAFPRGIVIIPATDIAGDQAIEGMRPDTTGDYNFKISTVPMSSSKISGMRTLCKAFPGFMTTLKGNFGPKIRGQVTLFLNRLTTWRTVNHGGYEEK